MSFEKNLKRLELIAESLKDANVPLEEAMELYEEGVKISSRLENELDSFERKIEILTNKPDESGNGITTLEDYHSTVIQPERKA